MMQVMRDGYWRDVAVHLCIVVLLGSAAAWGVAWAADALFGDAVTQLVGEAGEYDVLIQVRTEQREAAAEDLGRLVAQHLPGAELKQGVSIAGQTAYFLRVPASLRTAETFEALGGLLDSVSGFIGHTLMVEPSVSVSGLHPALFEEAERAAAQLSAVAFTFRQGDKLVAVLHEGGEAATVQESLRALLDRYALFELRLPAEAARTGSPPVDPARVEAILRDVWGSEHIYRVHRSGGDEHADALAATLTELRQFLLGHATHVFVPGGEAYVGRRLWLLPDVPDGEGPVAVQMEGPAEGGAWGFVLSGPVEERRGAWSAYEALPGGEVGRRVGEATLRNRRAELAAALDESLHLLHNLAGIAEEARLSVAEAEHLVASFDEALEHLQSLDRQIRELEKAIAETGGSAEATPSQALLGVLVTGWLNRLSGGAPQPVTGAVEERLRGIDLAALAGNLQAVTSGVAELAELNVDAVVEGIERMRRTLPLFTDEEIAESLQLIDRNLGGGIAGDRLTVVARPGVARDRAEQALAAGLGITDVRLVPTAGGVLAPNARAVLAQLLGQVRELVAALCTLIVALLVLLFDYSILFSMERLVHAERRDGRRGMVTIAKGAALGAALTGLIARMSGAELPFGGRWGLMGLGGVLGLACALLASRINPIDGDEVVAGVSLGLSHTQIMREIVVPCARPGLFVLLNRWRQVF